MNNLPEVQYVVDQYSMQAVCSVNHEQLWLHSSFTPSSGGIQTLDWQMPLLYWERIPSICFSQATFPINVKHKVQDQEYKLLKKKKKNLIFVFYEVCLWGGPKPKISSLTHYILWQWIRRWYLGEQQDGRLCFSILVYLGNWAGTKNRFELPHTFLLLLRVSLYWKRQLYNVGGKSKHYWHLLGDQHSQVLWKSPLP